MKNKKKEAKPVETALAAVVRVHKLKKGLKSPIKEGFQRTTSKSEDSVYLRDSHWKFLENEAESGDYRSKNAVLREILDQYFDIEVEE